MSDTQTNQIYDLLIIGAGSAGLSAGIYAGRAMLKTLIIDKEDGPGGQIKITNEVVNYPGIEHTTGPALSETMEKQAKNFGVEFVKADVLDVDFEGDIKTVKTTNGEYKAYAVTIASGAHPRRLGFPGEDEFQGRGIGFCATCDGEFFTGMDVFVIGAGFAAAEEAIFLTRYARKVTIIAREPEFTCSKTIAEKALNHPKIEVKFNSEVVEAKGSTVLDYAKFRNNQTGETWEFTPQNGDTTFGIFIFVGYVPLSEPFKGKIELDNYGYIPTDENMKTNVDGVYAAGDIRPKHLRQLVTAVADGAIAATEAEKYIVALKEKLGIKTEQPTYHEKPKSILDDDLKAQLKGIMERFQSTVTIKAVLDDGELSDEVDVFLADFATISDKVKLETYKKGENAQLEADVATHRLPAFALYDSTGEFTGIVYNGVPGGHEINSFIIALYNTAGPGQEISDELIAKIGEIDKEVTVQIGITLSCNNCPDAVVASQLIALKNPKVKAEMIDVSKFADFRTKHNIMSVPAIVINDGEVSFGKKNTEQLVSMILERV